MQTRKLLLCCGFIAFLLLSKVVIAQSLNDPLLKDMLEHRNVPVLEQPKSQPLPDYHTPKFNENIHSEAEQPTAQNADPLGDYLRSLDKQPSHQQQTVSPQSLRPQTFHADKEQLNRFRNSPCWQSLGYDPSESYEVQEARYRSCEDARASKTGTTIILTFVIIISTGFLIFLGVRKSAETANNSGNN